MKQIIFCGLVSFGLLADEGIFPNQDLKELKESLIAKCDSAKQLMENKAAEESYVSLLDEVKTLKKQIHILEKSWKEESAPVEEETALWDMGEITLSQLVMEYGASEYLYIVPPELSTMKLHLFCNIPLPRESWEEMIQTICMQNGVGVKTLNTFAKQLYVLKSDPASIEGIITDSSKLAFFAKSARICFILSPEPENLKSVLGFFEKFSDPKRTQIQAIGSKLALIANRDTLEKLLEMHRMVWEQKSQKVARLAKFSKLQPQEGEKVLKSFFQEGAMKARPPYMAAPMDELTTLSLEKGLVLVGPARTVDRAQQMIEELEVGIEEPEEQVVYWYACKHANPEDIASVLEKVYDSLTQGLSEGEKKAALSLKTEEKGSPPNPFSPSRFQPAMPAKAPFIQPLSETKQKKTHFGNFIVDEKTTSILMVVKKETLSQIKALLKKLDSPKRMVQLDVLLVEKKLTDRKQVGMNLLQIGAPAKHTTKNGLSFDNQEAGSNKGVVSFMISRPSKKPVAFDLMYNFLMGQEDIRINANPSVLAINKTPAQISIVEEISINNGAIPIQVNTSGAVSVEKSYSRAQYGITIHLTPTIHLSDEEEESAGFVSLETNLEFDTTKTSEDDRPPVSRRHIENQVCVADGETVILGGLRRKIEESSQEKIPFLGDLPGIGKLFGMTKTIDTSTETFIFITPHIVRHSIDDLRRIRQREYQKRAGDIPEFLELLDEAKEINRKNLFDRSFKMLFGS